jgi:hypothetical protein
MCARAKLLVGTGTRFACWLLVGGWVGGWVCLDYVLRARTLRARPTKRQKEVIRAFGTESSAKRTQVSHQHATCTARREHPDHPTHVSLKASQQSITAKQQRQREREREREERDRSGAKSVVAASRSHHSPVSQWLKLVRRNAQLGRVLFPTHWAHLLSVVLGRRHGAFEVENTLQIITAKAPT